MMLSQAILPPQLFHLNTEHFRVLPTKTSFNCRRNILPSPIMSSKAVLPSIVPKFSLLPDTMANPEAADVYEQLNRNITTRILRTKVGFSNDEISSLTDDEISEIMEAVFVKIPFDELFPIMIAESHKLPKGKHKRFMKAYMVRRFPLAKFLIDLLMPTNLIKEQEDKDNQVGCVEATSGATSRYSLWDDIDVALYGREVVRIRKQKAREKLAKAGVRNIAEEQKQE